MRRPWAAGLAVLSFVALIGAVPDTVQTLADQAHPRISEIAHGLTVDTWSERVGSFVTAAPTASIAGANWRPGDPHWESAKRNLLGHVDQWTTDLLADPQAIEIVRRSFATSLSADRATAIQPELAAEATHDLPALQDRIHLMVRFAEKHPELKIGTPEFTAASSEWIERMKLGSGMPEQTDALIALMRSSAGGAYGQARAFATDALVTALDGQLELRFFDLREAILEEIAGEAKACARAHRQ
jgi:hypothetical protein